MQKKIIFWFSVVLFAVVLHVTGLIEWLDHQVVDKQFEVLRKIDIKPVEQEVVVIGIDEQTVNKIREPIAFWHEKLGRFFMAMKQLQPAAVGLDIILPDRSYDFIRKGQDKKLLLGLIQVRRSFPVVLGITINQDGSVRKVYPVYLSAAGKDSNGLIIWKRDSDQKVRRFNENLGENGERVPTLSGTLARRLGVEPGKGLIDYSVGNKLGYIPLIDVLEKHAAGNLHEIKQLIEGKVVLLGSVLSDADLHQQVVNITNFVPAEKKFVPGIYLHAQALRSMLNNGLIKPLDIKPTLFLVAITLLLWWLPLKFWQSSLAVVVFTFGGLTVSSWLLWQGTHWPVTGFIVSLVLALMSRQLYDTLMQIMERKRLRQAFDGVVSPQVLQQILNGSLPLTDKRDACILFSDIRGYTSISEGKSPEEVLNFLNSYYERILPAIHENDGTLIAFMGDGIMVAFGAPNDLDNACQSAFNAVKSILNILDDYNQQLVTEGKQTIRIGVGLNYGEVIAGNVGSSQRNEYTTIGDTTNTAARLEGMTKDKGYTLLCTDAVVEQLVEKDEFVDLGEVPVRGRSSVYLFGWGKVEST